MDYTRSELEDAIIGTILNDMGYDGFMASCSMSLKREMFSDRRNAFIFGILDDMRKDGLTSTTPYDVYMYAREKEVKFRDPVAFCSYLCDLSDRYYAYKSFRSLVKELVKIYVNDIRRNGKGR